LKNLSRVRTFASDAHLLFQPWQLNSTFGLPVNGLMLWTRYRKWKHAVVPPLVLLALFLMEGAPDDSARWMAGMCIAALLGIAYIAEEIVWITQNRGRPCAKCGQRFHLKPFSLRIRCPHCGYWE
jgi:hypothetical protein